eukprot:Blabericola_migrator_1__10930@NODE_6317_length_560_cov_193_841785_g1288_i2_p1_GENE_NODE_6317_length_560_cov_193_841785_g1288_i2NODE_6317_length_560_cov_193_841785_g1288_i2_p1_ORF_typecomplete_len118_score15_70_NODE_6317_length_560_cov_193_841785_g1288_i2207560
MTCQLMQVAHMNPKSPDHFIEAKYQDDDHHAESRSFIKCVKKLCSGGIKNSESDLPIPPLLPLTPRAPLKYISSLSAQSSGVQSDPLPHRGSDSLRPSSIMTFRSPLHSYKRPGRWV